MKSPVKKVAAMTIILILMASSLFAGVSVRSTAGATRFFEMAVGTAGGFLVDGVSAGVDALLDMGSENKVSLEANAKKAADNSMSVLTFNASFYRDAEIMTDVMGLACKGGVSFSATENFEVVMSAGVRNMFFSSATAVMYSTPSSVSMVGVDAGLECTYKF